MDVAVGSGLDAAVFDFLKAIGLQKGSKTRVTMRDGSIDVYAVKSLSHHVEISFHPGFGITSVMEAEGSGCLQPVNWRDTVPASVIGTLLAEIQAARPTPASEAALNVAFA